MVNIISTTLPVAFAALAAARVCRDLTVEVQISARNGVFNISTPQTNLDVTNLMLGLSQQGNNYTAQNLQGYATVGGTYQLGATYCEPSTGPGRVLQILTHGIGFDRSYWDLPVNGRNYSYVSPAVDAYGFSTLAWDRLGVARSSRGDPVAEIQAPLEVAALAALTDRFRAPGVAIPNLGDRRFGKIVHVGHSFGSAHSYALAAARPDASDGVVLTGFAQNGTFFADFLLGGAFVQADTLPPPPGDKAYAAGYFASAYEGGAHVNFFAPGDFDPAVLTAAYRAGRPVTAGELLTIGGETATGPNAFTKPVLVITGERDVPFCGGDCLATGDPKLSSIPAASARSFPNASAFEAYIIPGAGHGLAFSYSHDLVTEKILDFLVQNGLGSN